MATPTPNEWGPAFWETGYGYADFDAFYADAEQLLEGVRFGPIGPPTELLARTAWYNPGSGIGVYVAGRLLLDSGSGNPIKNDGRSLAELKALQTEQENTMATLIIPNAFQVSIEMEAGGQEVVNVVGVTNAAGTAEGAAQAVKSAWEGVGKPLVQLSSLIAVRNYRAVDLSSALGDIADVESVAVGGVTTSNAFATLGSAALIQWNGATRSRSTRGRLYFGPQRETVINADGRTLTSAAITAFTDAFEAFRTTLNGAGYPLAVLSRKNQTAYPVTSAVCQPIIATQRRRIR